MAGTAPGNQRGQVLRRRSLLWKIVDRKLYMNHNKEIAKNREQDIHSFFEKADHNWHTLNWGHWANDIGGSA